MYVSKYLPTVGVPLWPCAALLVLFIPVSILHERNWRRTLVEYAQARIAAGASDDGWPSRDLRRVMGVQPALVLVACALLGVVVGVGLFAALLWPYRPPFFEMAINPFDLPYLWATLVCGIAVIVAGVAIAYDASNSPWRKVAAHIRRSMYAPPAEKQRRFQLALAVDPGTAHGVSADPSADTAPQQP